MILQRPLPNTNFIILPSRIKQTTQIPNQTEAESSDGGRYKAAARQRLPDGSGQRFGPKTRGETDRRRGEVIGILHQTTDRGEGLTPANPLLSNHRAAVQCSGQ